MTDIFAPLDNIRVDPQAFTIQEPFEKAYQNTGQGEPSRESALTDCTIVVDSLASEGMSNGQVVSSFLSLSIHESEGTSLDGCEKENCAPVTVQPNPEKLQDKVHVWLSRLPEQPETTQLCEDEKQPDTEDRPISQSAHSLGPEQLGKAQEVSATMREVTENNLPEGGGLEEYEDESPEPQAMTKPGGIMDGYHSALLHIHMLSDPEGCSKPHLRPSMRRYYPKVSNSEGWMPLV
ncbi:hypothetical protein F66182_1447 [Fusarium sp. NRRL 66182]|nr:hypothetical protein F66182_1447 [Fusarium sp. NRRL 66182]